MKKRISFVFSAFLLAAALVVPGSALAGPPTSCADVTLGNPSSDKKVTLCHFTGSATNPFNVNEVSLSALDSHLGHHGDCYKKFDEPTVCIP